MLTNSTGNFQDFQDFHRKCETFQHVNPVCRNWNNIPLFSNGIFIAIKVEAVNVWKLGKVGFSNKYKLPS